MTRHSGDFAWYQSLGILVFVLCCGIPGLELGGFGDVLGLGLEEAAVVATIGGLVGGALLCPKPILAGLIGGVIAGPAGLFAVYYYVQQRAEVWNGELVIIQGLASLPGLGVGFLLKKLLTRNPRPQIDDSDHETNWREVK